MWECPNCGENIDDEFDECWKCDSSGEMDESIQDFINPEKDNVTCPECGSMEITKRFFGKKTSGVSVFFIILGVFILYRLFTHFPLGPVTLATLMPLIMGLAAVSYGISGLIGKYKCGECGAYFK